MFLEYSYELKNLTPPPHFSIELSDPQLHFSKKKKKKIVILSFFSL